MTRRLRVMHVSGCLDMGGQEKLLVEFARHADRARFELRFVSLGGRGLIAEELAACGWPVTALDVERGLHLRLPLRLAKLMRSTQIDIVHTHNDRPLIYAAPAGRLARVTAVIHTKHGRSTGNSRRQNLLTCMAARLTDHFVCVSHDCAQLALAQGVPPSRIRTLHNGIDTQRFAAVGPCPIGPAVVVARLCADKDLATLLHATALVRKDEPDFRLWIAGTGPCETDLRHLSDALHLADHVRFLGLVRDVPGLLRQARLFVLSSISEGIPLTLLEAMASGLPVAATRVGGVAEVVADGVTGLLVAPGDPAALASALLRLQRDAGFAWHLGEAGRRRVEQRFDARHMVRQYEQLYLGTMGPLSPVFVSPQPQTAGQEVQACASHT